MKNLLKKVIIKRHYLILEEKDVTKTLDVINRHETFFISQKLVVGNCEWAAETKWFIHFSASESQWESIKDDFKKEGLNSIFKRVRRLVEERI